MHRPDSSDSAPPHFQWFRKEEPCSSMLTDFHVVASSLRWSRPSAPWIKTNRWVATASFSPWLHPSPATSTSPCVTTKVLSGMFFGVGQISKIVVFLGFFPGKHVAKSWTEALVTRVSLFVQDFDTHTSCCRLNYLKHYFFFFFCQLELSVMVKMMQQCLFLQLSK